MPVDRGANVRCRARLVGSDSSRWLLETLGMHDLRKKAARILEGAPLFSIYDVIFAGQRINPVVGAPGPIGHVDRSLGRSIRRSRRRRLSRRSAPPQCQRGIAAKKTKVNSAGVGYRLSVLCRPFDPGYGQSLVLPSLQHRPVLGEKSL